MSVELSPDLMPVRILFESTFMGAVAELAGGKVAWVHDSKAELFDSVDDLPFTWIEPQHP